MKPLSDEEQLQQVALGLTNPMSRRVFLKLAAAAGATLAVPWAATGATSKAATGATSKAATTKGLVVNQIPTLQNEFYASWGRGYEDSAKALGLTTRTLTNEFQPTRELAQARGLKGAGARMLVGIASDQSQVPAIARICQRSKVYYNPCFEDPPWFTPQDVGDYYVTFVTPRSEQAAYEVAKALFDSIGKEGEVIHIRGREGPTDSFRTFGVRRAAKEYPGIKLVGNQRSDWTREAGRKLTLNLLSAYPDAKGIFAQNDSIALGVLSVLKERNNKDVKVVGVDAIPEVLGELERGPNFVATHNSVGFYIAGFAAVNVFDALNGWKPTTPERLLQSGGILITQKNVKELKTKLYDNEASAFDWPLMSRTLHPTDWDPQFEIIPAKPQVLWKGFPKDRPLNKAWTQPGINAQIAKARKLYRDHYKTGPLKGQE